MINPTTLEERFDFLFGQYFSIIQSFIKKPDYTRNDILVFIRKEIEDAIAKDRAGRLENIEDPDTIHNPGCQWVRQSNCIYRLARHCDHPEHQCNCSSL